MKKIDSTYLKATYQQIQVSKLLKTCMNETAKNGKISHVSQRKELNIKGRNHMNEWQREKTLQEEKVLCKPIVIRQGTK